jgi:hypothetical protein
MTPQPRRQPACPLRARSGQEVTRPDKAPVLTREGQSGPSLGRLGRGRAVKRRPMTTDDNQQHPQKQQASHRVRVAGLVGDGRVDLYAGCCAARTPAERSYSDEMETPGRALPKSDYEAILGVVSILSGYLVVNELPEDFTDRLIRRLVEHGPLEEGASAGGLNLLLGDLAQRMHWAMSDEDTPYPGPSPRRNTFYLELPGTAAQSCMEALTALGGANIRTAPGPTGNWTTHPTGPDGELERQSTDMPGSRKILVDFPDLAPDAAYHERVHELESLVGRWGGRFLGAGW